MQKVYTKIESIVGNVVTVRASGVRSGDLALVGESYASVIKLSGDLVSLQVFAGTQGISTTDTNEAYTKELVMKRADHVFVLADSSKLGVSSFVFSGDISDIDTLISDPGIPQNILKKLKTQNIEVIF